MGEDPLIVAVAALIALLTLTASGSLHLARIQRFRDALLAQRVWPLTAVSSISVVIATAEFALGVGGIAGLLLSSGLEAFALAFSSLLFVAYACYLGFLVLRRPDAPCGCSAEAADVASWKTVARSLALAAISLVGLLGATAPSETWSFAETVLTILAAGALSVAVWILPSSLDEGVLASALSDHARAEAWSRSASLPRSGAR